jgi:hypothetical protein
MDFMSESPELQEHARLLIELNEPEALLESLKRVCQFKVDSFVDGLIPPEEAARWRTAASALSEAMKTITQAQEPAEASHEHDEPDPVASQSAEASSPIEAQTPG